MITNLSKKVEVCAHIGIILMTLLLGYVVVRLDTFLAPLPRPNANTPARRGLAAGMKVSTPGIDWEKSDQTLLLVLSTACTPCKGNAPFYKRIVEELQSIKGTHLMAVFPQGVTQDITNAKQFLSDMGLAIDDVKPVAPGSIGVTGFPALVLVDKTGTAKNVWVGNVPVEKEVEVIDALKCDKC